MLRRGTENTGAPTRSSAGEAPLPAYLAGQRDRRVSWVSVSKFGDVGQRDSGAMG